MVCYGQHKFLGRVLHLFSTIDDIFWVVESSCTWSSDDRVVARRRVGNLDGRDVLHWLTQCHSTQEQLPGDREGMKVRRRRRGREREWDREEDCKEIEKEKEGKGEEGEKERERDGKREKAEVKE